MSEQPKAKPMAWLVEGDSVHLDPSVAERRAQFVRDYTRRAINVIPLYIAPSGVESGNVGCRLEMGSDLSCDCRDCQQP